MAANKAWGLNVGMVYALSILGLASMAGAQTNVNIYGEGGTSAPPRDTVMTKDTVLVEEETAAGTTVIEENTVAEPDVAVQDANVDTVGDIEPSDVKRLERRKEAKRFGMAGFGPATFGNSLMDDEDDRISYDIYLGRAWEVNPRAAIKSQLGVTSDFDDNHIADLSLGANFYALPTDFSPYVGGDLGLGVGRADSENVFGFTAGASLGALLFRTANAQMNLEGGAEVMLSELDDEFPTVYSATIGVLF
jgi:hypothetical protein